jgi:hypothetical protein
MFSLSLIVTKGQALLPVSQCAQVGKRSCRSAGSTKGAREVREGRVVGGRPSGSLEVVGVFVGGRGGKLGTRALLGLVLADEHPTEEEDDHELEDCGVGGRQ